MSDPSDEYDATDDFAKSLDVAYDRIRQRMRDGGPSWEPGATFVPAPSAKTHTSEIIMKTQ